MRWWVVCGGGEGELRVCVPWHHAVVRQVQSCSSCSVLRVAGEWIGRSVQSSVELEAVEQLKQLQWGGVCCEVAKLVRASSCTSLQNSWLTDTSAEPENSKLSTASLLSEHPLHLHTPIAPSRRVKHG